MVTVFSSEKFSLTCIIRARLCAVNQVFRITGISYPAPVSVANPGSDSLTRLLPAGIPHKSVEQLPCRQPAQSHLINIRSHSAQHSLPLPHIERYIARRNQSVTQVMLYRSTAAINALSVEENEAGAPLVVFPGALDSHELLHSFPRSRALPWNA
jgi:hypothetical protein